MQGAMRLRAVWISESERVSAMNYQCRTLAYHESMKDTKATIRYAGDDFFVAVPPSGHALTLDMRGERSSAASPFELLLVAVGGCTAADVVSILGKKREVITEYVVEVHSQRREEHPKSLKRVEIRHILHGRSLNEKSVADAIRLSNEKYCGVAATIRPTAEIVTSYEIHEQVLQP
jgi:putative redox protein